MDWRGCGRFGGFRKHQAQPLGDDTSCLWKCPNRSQGPFIALLQDGHLSGSELATNSGLAFADPVEGITTSSHLVGKIVALPRQCPLPWVGVGDQPTVGVLRSEFTFNEDPSKLDGMAHLLWKGVVPIEMLNKVVEALETRPCDTWDPSFNDFPVVHRGPDSGNRRMFALRLPHGDVEGSGVGYHECEALMSFTNFVLSLFNNTWRRDHKAYQAAAIGAKGREMQSYHRDMMKVPDGRRVVFVFAALDEDL